MLLELNVRDVALIRSASVSFGKGLNILTGETGTGKSVIIDSVMLALGARVRGDMIRTGAESAYIELVFSADDEKISDSLKGLGVYPDEEGTVIISRRIMPGRSIGKINDETVTLQRLREVTSKLIDIYGQNEFHTLMDNRKHLEILDSFAEREVAGIKAEIKAAFKEYKDDEKKLSAFNMNEKERLREIDVLTFETGEISAAALKDGEEEELARNFKKMNNARRIAESIGEAYDCLRGLESERAVYCVEQALKYDEELQGIYDELMDAQSILDSAISDLGEYIDGLDVDESLITETENRLDLIRNLEAKYGSSIEDILEYRSRAEQRLSELAAYDERKAEAGSELKKAEQRLLELCGRLSGIRKKSSKELCGLISQELKGLGFEKAYISMSFMDTALSDNGSDEVCFTASLNPGEPEKPLSEVASGGELSRVMLAIKTVLARTDDMPSLVFDEIDTGISGRTAQQVAERMMLIAKRHQVICVSHLPQIAAMADTHFVIRKEEKDGRNVTEIERLDEAGSLSELARLLGGAVITDAVLGNAAEMKRQAREFKEQNWG